MHTNSNNSRNVPLEWQSRWSLYSHLFIVTTVDFIKTTQAITMHLITSALL